MITFAHLSTFYFFYDHPPPSPNESLLSRVRREISHRCETDAKFFPQPCEIKCSFRFVYLRCETGKVVAKLVAKQENSLRNLLQNSKMRSETGCKIEQYDAKLVAKQQKRCETLCKTAKC